MGAPIGDGRELEKEYSIGWIANAEAAYGTENKYLGRVFALRFTDCSRLAFFGNINNTNDTRRAGSKGDWTPSYLPNGLQTSRTAGGEYNYEDRQGNFKWNSNFNVSHTDNHTVTSTNSESFCPQEVLSHRAMTTHAATPLISKRCIPSLCLRDLLSIMVM